MPVPAGPIPKTMSFFAISSRYARWLRLRGDDHLLAPAHRGLQQVVAQARLAVPREQLRREAHVGGGHGVAVLHEPGQLLEDLPGQGGPLLVPLDEEVASLVLDADLEGVLEEAEILVLVSEEGLADPVPERRRGSSVDPRAA